MLNLEEIETLIIGSAMTKEETWEMAEARSELDYEEFEEIWAARPEKVVVQ